MITKFEGKWKANSFNDKRDSFFVQYEFKGDEFIFTDLRSGYKVYGNFTFDDNVINFEVFYQNDKWSQKYSFNDRYFDLQCESKRWDGRFYKIEQGTNT